MSVCQRVALPYSELIGVMIGASSAESAEVVLVAEEEHLVGQQRLVDLLDHRRVQVRPEAHPVDPGADTATQLGDGHWLRHFVVLFQVIVL
jgi:hypothetical protein